MPIMNKTTEQKPRSRCRKTRPILTAAVIFLTFMAAVLPFSARAAGLDTGVVLTDDRGRILYARNPEQPLVPASILKLLTGLSALHYLGKDHRFPTHFHADHSSGDLYIKGFGDPLLTSEVLRELGRDILKRTGIRKIRDIVLDQSHYEDAVEIPGRGRSLNPYDAPVGALCANFNTLAFTWDPRRGFVSGEPQTPLLPVFVEDIRKTGLKQGRITLTRTQSDLYPGRLLAHGFREQGIEVSGRVRKGAFPLNPDPVFVFLSPHRLSDAVQKMLHYSSNFIANQLLLSEGALVFGPPATLDKGIRTLQAFAARELGLKGLSLSEGSGLSRANRISPAQMIRVLEHFRPWQGLLNREGGDIFKTGTLSGVRTRAGYLVGPKKRLYPYVIMVNRDGVGYDAILKELKNRAVQAREADPLSM